MFSAFVASLAWIAACSGGDGASGTSAGAGGSATTAMSSTTGAASGAGGSAGSAGAGGTAADAGAPDDVGGPEAVGTSDGGCGGPVPTTIADVHCATPDGGRGDGVGPHEGSEADDDNCLYHATIKVPCIHIDQSVMLTLDLRNIGTTTPATGADPQVEGTVGYHPWPNTNPTSTENNGVYTVGPVLFDRVGKWTVTFHVYDPVPAKHSHVSFYIGVP